MEPAITQQLKATLKRFLEKERNPKKWMNPSGATDFIEQEPALCRRFLVEQIKRMIRSEQRKASSTGNPEEEEQMQFLGEDFARLFNGPRQRLPLKESARGRPVRSMTVSQLRESAIAIRARVSPPREPAGRIS